MFLFRYILFFTLFLLSNNLKAVGIIDYNTDSLLYIGEDMLYYEDATNQVTINKLLASPAPFKPSEVEVPNFGTTKSTYWFKFNFTNITDHNDLVLNLETPLLNYAVLYKVKGDSLVDSIVIYSYADEIHRVFDHQFYTFKFWMENGESATYYLKTSSDIQLQLPVSINTKDTTVNKLLYFDLRTGIFIGIMIAMLLYNLFLYVSARDKQYLYYVNYIFWVTFAQAAVLGLFHRFLNDSYSIANYLVPFAGAMSGIASVIFVNSFLNLKLYSKRFTIYLKIIVFADLLAILLLFYDISIAYSLVNAVAGIGSIFVLYIAVYTFRKGNETAGLFLVAWGIFLSTVIVYVLKDMGIVKYSQFTTYIVQLGVSAEAMLLSFALGNKINTYRKEKELSQKRELKALQENERLIREQNELLEIKIEERTHELQIANESLQQTLEDLKEAQSQLVESEKMASLGQLTAGVAHEINNPINFVTANVQPLKRDLEMVWEAFTFIETIAYNDSLSIDEKKTQVVKYKNDQDIDYLKTEIDFLLKGMHDGASRTAEIVKSLRIFSRVDEDSVMRADINLGIESTLVIIGSLLSENITLEKNLNTLPQVECYPGKLNQVFLNIFTNAIYAIDKKYGGKPGGTLKISSVCLDDKEEIQIVIEDNGIGIPADVIGRIFDPFFTTKDVGEGTGLGMSIAYNTVAKHNGGITVDSKEGLYTIFTINLPINQ